MSKRKGAQGRHYVGVDVGTSSARAAVVDADGCILATHSANLAILANLPDHYEQSSDDIWQACCKAVATAVKASGIDSTTVKGIGFDATCSLVALDASFKPVSVTKGGKNKWNVVMWMDHRAQAEADEMSATGHVVLQRTGGRISPEMSAAKLLWIHRNNPELFRTGATFMELPDFLTFKATGNPDRGINSLTCKWTYAPGAGFDDEFWAGVGMGEAVEDQYPAFLGTGNVLDVAESAGTLTVAAAKDMGIDPCAGVQIGSAVIDAYAGALGTLGASLNEAPLTVDSVESRMAVICGTSSCHIALTPKKLYIEGVWGPYADVLLPSFHAHEGGQSWTGHLLTHIIATHPASKQLNVSDPFTQLNHIAGDLAASEGFAFPALLTKNVHITPDWHGNRSPFADATMRGVHFGVEAGDSLNHLAKVYLAVLLSLCYGTRQIVDTLNAQGHRVDTLFLSGGLLKNPLFVQAMADCTRCTVVLPREADAVLLGAAILGATVAEEQAGKTRPLWECAVRMGGKAGQVIAPCEGEEAEFHERKYKVFEKLYTMQRELKAIMAGNSQNRPL
ncbi:hypothetical protein HKX48_002186 [Thoreauomyces humboldtii]|nr:hypothetical protein HKX48_002186 [Thoreauomyces humboldtii]